MSIIKDIGCPLSSYKGPNKGGSFSAEEMNNLDAIIFPQRGMRHVSLMENLNTKEAKENLFKNDTEKKLVTDTVDHLKKQNDMLNQEMKAKDGLISIKKTYREEGTKGVKKLLEQSAKEVKKAQEDLMKSQKNNPDQFPLNLGILQQKSQKLDQLNKALHDSNPSPVIQKLLNDKYFSKKEYLK